MEFFSEQVTISIMKYSENEVVTSWTTHTGGQANTHFPAVSICNLNRWKKSAIEEYSQGNYSIMDWDDLDYELFRWGDDLQQFLW